MCSCNTCNNGKGCSSKKTYTPYELENIDWLGWGTNFLLGKDIEIEKYNPTTKELVKAYVQVTNPNMTNMKKITQLSDLVKLFVPNIEKVIFNKPATIVFWEDGSKTVVKCSEEFEDYDKEKGLAFCFLKKLYGDKYYQKMLKPVVKKFTKEDIENTEIIKIQTKKQITKGGKNEKW